MHAPLKILVVHAHTIVGTTIPQLVSHGLGVVGIGCSYIVHMCIEIRE